MICDRTHQIIPSIAYNFDLHHTTRWRGGDSREQSLLGEGPGTKRGRKEDISFILNSMEYQKSSVTSHWMITTRTTIGGSEVTRESTTFSSDVHKPILFHPIEEEYEYSDPINFEEFGDEANHTSKVKTFNFVQVRIVDTSSDITKKSQAELNGVNGRDY
ncbi:hypothetical protein ACTXT7_004849 [Hymenolepis weldensis]